MTFTDGFKQSNPLLHSMLENTELASSLTAKSVASSFDDTYKAAYSHGLEAIYAIETIDVKSIRPIASTPVKKKTTPQLVLPVEKISDQMEFDFGDAHRGWIDSFITLEPIHVLGLSRHAEKCLFEHGKQTLGDLIQADLNAFVFFKGMGQGHVDEIRQKLAQYLEGRSLTHCKKIDFASWIRSIVASHDRKKVFVAMEKYQLSDLFSLSPAESVETRRLTLEKKQEWLQEATRSFQTEGQIHLIKEQVKKIVDVFIKPWMKRRHGLATRQEIDERVLRLSINATEATRAIRFLSDLYFNKEFLFQEFLIPLENGVFCTDAVAQERYFQIMQCTHTYFYQPAAIYPLAQLISLLEKEFALKWIGFPEGLLDKIFRLASSFIVRKGSRHQIEIRLA